MDKFKRASYPCMVRDGSFHVAQRSVAALVADPKQDRVWYDDDIHGFGVRVTKAGVKSFVLNYYVDLRQRRLTIGRCSEMAAKLAREKAEKIRAGARDGIDPLRKREIIRAENTVADLAAEYMEKYALVNKRPNSIYEDRRMLKAIILPKLGKLRVSAVERDDVETMHASLKKTPYQANRVLALTSKMFTYAMERKWRTDNPARGIPRFHEDKREAWFSVDQLHTLSDALDAYSVQDAADALRLLIVTGSRPHEVIGASWSQFDLQRGVWTKPSHHTKENKIEHVPLSEAALTILRRMRQNSSETEGFLFPGRDPGTARTTLHSAWKQVCKAAGFATISYVKGRRGKLLPRWKPTVRVYDFRHSFASHLISRGASLPIVGKLMGHTQPGTTARYAHVADSALRDVANAFPEILPPQKMLA